MSEPVESSVATGTSRPASYVIEEQFKEGASPLVRALFDFGCVAGATAQGIGMHVLREAADRLADHLAAPEDGRPTWDELAASLRECVDAIGEGYLTRIKAFDGARALLSRIPKEEPHGS